MAKKHYVIFKDDNGYYFELGDSLEAIIKDARANSIFGGHFNYSDEIILDEATDIIRNACAQITYKELVEELSDLEDL